MKKHHIKKFPCIKQSAFRVLQYFPLNYCNFHLYLVVTSIKQSCSPYLSPNGLLYFLQTGFLRFV